MIEDRPIPADPDIERAVISELMNEGDYNILRSLVFRLHVDDFYIERYMKYFIAMIELVKRDMPIDCISLSSKYPECSIDLNEIFSECATTAFLPSRIIQLKEFSARRAAIKKSLKLNDSLYVEDNPLELIEEASIDLAKVATDNKPKKDFTTEDTLRNVNQIIKDSQSGKSNLAIPYCIPAMDCKLTLLRKQMEVLAAHSGIGKTSLAVSCLRVQPRQGYKVAMFCGESSKEELALRLIAIETQKPLMWYILGMPGATELDMKKYIKAVERFREYSKNYWIYGKGDYEHSTLGIRDIMTMLSNRFGQLDKIYVDYLQNMKAPKGGGRMNNEERTSYNAEGVNNILADFDVAGTLLSQVNRESNKSSRPYKEHLKYASTIENEAHIITFLHREKDAEPVNGILETQWYSDKARVQQDIFAKLAFHPERMEYTGMLSESYRGNESLNANQKE